MADITRERLIELLKKGEREWEGSKENMLEQQADLILAELSPPAVVTQSQGEVIYQEFHDGKWEDIDKEQYEFKMDEGWPVLRKVFADLTPALSHTEEE